MLTHMACINLSTVIEKQIQRLHLNDFPCGPGSWRKTKDSPDDPQTEDTDSLLMLLNCPHSPWAVEDDSWSPQAPALKQHAVMTPQRLHKDFIYSYFTTLRIVDKGVSVIDDGLLKYTKLEELVLTGNNISAIPPENLPSTLKILGLRYNLLSDLNSLGNHQLPCLQYLSLASNNLGSHDDIRYLTGRQWPQLVCLDLSNCDFQDQQALHKALITLTRLRTLVLEGNPLTLAPSYRGFTVDGLPRLSYLDATWISPEERHNFRGLAKRSDLIVDQASVTVRVGQVKGIPNPQFPATTCSYFITYEFLSHQTVNLNFDSDSKVEAAHAMDSADGLSDADTVQSNGSHENASKPDKQDITVYTDDSAHVSRHSTSKLRWSECLDFTDTQTYIVSDLRGLKKFFNRGLYLTITEEKTPVKPGSTKDKSKDRKKKSEPELVQDAPTFRSLGRVHVPLQTLVSGGQKVHVLCATSPSDSVCSNPKSQTLEKDLEKKIQEEDKNKDLKQGGKNPAASKGRGKGRKEMDVHADNTVSVPLGPVTVELTVELEKWQSASEAHQLLCH